MTSFEEWLKNRGQEFPRREEPPPSEYSGSFSRLKRQFMGLEAQTGMNNVDVARATIRVLEQERWDEWAREDNGESTP